MKKLCAVAGLTCLASFGAATNASDRAAQKALGLWREETDIR